MCAIVDASGAEDVFGKDRPEIGIAFFNWIEEHGHIVTGGKLTREIRSSCPNFILWAQEAERTRKLIKISKSNINVEMNKITKNRYLRSNDTHVLAIARAGEARLLYSNDKPLLEDFVDSRFIRRPQGDTMTSYTGGDLSDEDQEKLDRATKRCRQQTVERD